MNKGDIEALSKLARINLTEEEKENYAHDMGSILAYVDKIKEVATEDVPAETGPVYNVFREDEVVNKYGDSEKIKEQFPEREGEYLKVKSILNN